MSVAVLEPPVAVIPPPPPKTARPVKTFRNATGLEIKDAILHIVDHWKGAQPILSDVGLLQADVTLEEILNNFLLDEVRHVLEDVETADAKFMEDDHEVAATARRMLTSSNNFVEDSKIIAQALWNATGMNKSIAPGSLIVARFQAKNHPVPFLALLKVDLTKVFVQTVLRSGGLVTVGLKMIDDALPTADVRLQKAALIAPEGFARCDMLLLDRLVSAPAAEFFAKRFLNVKPMPTPQDRVRNLHRVTTKIMNSFGKPGEPSITKTEWDTVNAVMDQVYHRRKVDLPEVVSGLDVSAPVRERVLNGFKEELDVLAFEIDPTFAAKKLLKKKFRGGYGIVVEFDKEFEKDCFSVGAKYMEGTDEITEVLLKVPNLEWVK